MALDFMFSYLAGCAKGKGSYAEAVVGALFFGGTIIAGFLSLVAFALGGEGAPATWLFLLDVANAVYLLFAGYCVWRCAFNVKYWQVGFVTRSLVIFFASVYGAYLWSSFAKLPNQ